MRFDSDATLAFQVHRVQHLLHHFALGQRAGHLEQTIGERRFAMIDVSDDGEVSDESGIHAVEWGPETSLSHMSQVIEGNLDAHGLKFAIICARFNSFITERLLAGATDALKRSGANPDDIEIVKVPGSWELPLLAKTLATQKRHDAIIALGAVIRGETPHFDHVSAQAASGFGAVALE